MPAAPALTSFSWLLVLLVPLGVAAAALAVRARRRRPPPLSRALIAGALERPRRWPRR